MIRIVSVKLFVPNLHSNRIYEFSSGLTQIASTFPGYIHSENLWNYGAHNAIEMGCDTMFTISKWKTINDWNTWLYSQKRKQFIDSCKHNQNIGDILKSSNFYQVNELEVLNNLKGYYFRKQIEVAKRILKNFK